MPLCWRAFLAMVDRRATVFLVNSTSLHLGSTLAEIALVHLHESCSFGHLSAIVVSRIGDGIACKQGGGNNRSEELHAGNTRGRKRSMENLGTGRRDGG